MFIIDFEAMAKKQEQDAREMGWSDDFVLKTWPLSAHARKIARERRAAQQITGADAESGTGEQGGVAQSQSSKAA